MAFSSLSLPLSLLCYISAVSRVIADSPIPLAAKWSDLSFGPDGPWPAVELTIGNDQTIALYPGHEFQSFLLTTDYCNGNDTCTASTAHLYNQQESQIDHTGSTNGVGYSAPPGFMNGLTMVGDNAAPWSDTVTIGDVRIPTVGLALLSSAYALYPDNTWYPLSVGCFGVGAPRAVNQSFSTKEGQPAVNVSLVPGWLSAKNEIPSNSFAMHIGSANPPMPGSLYFGGYDQNRVIGDIINGMGDYTKNIPLKDIGITVVEGSSPWGFSSQNGLLAENNASIPSAGLPVTVDGCSPYLSLPKSTCDAITKYLPVTYNADLGLYIWQQDDPQYSLIVSSASSLDFTFVGGSNLQEVTISVPFRHLNLTLSAPLVNSNQQYFPCYTGPHGGYTLGRAFLQDAFVGANWGANTWWLAQAPGPNIPNAKIVNIEEKDTTIQASMNDWKESWSGSWKVLTPDDVAPDSKPTATSSTATTSTDTSENQKSGGLSTGAAAGIGVGAGVVVLSGVIAALVFLRRRRAAACLETSPLPHAAELPGAEPAFYKGAKYPYRPQHIAELGSDTAKH
ncbi:aspartic peptidase domain-containing protein [Xylaria intraflava]|nr:aspartic peptidase domain-containing protein [Xylaria intraflava]